MAHGEIADAHAELLERWRGWQRSIEARDATAAARFLDDDYHLQLVLPTRAVFPRSEWLQTLADYVVHGYEVAESIVSIDGDLAVVFHRAHMRATVFGADRSGEFVITDVWRRRDGQWRVWRRQSTPLTAGAMPSQAR
jgi:ketosteroid isomerase-like protein